MLQNTSEIESRPDASLSVSTHVAMVIWRSCANWIDVMQQENGCHMFPDPNPTCVPPDNWQFSSNRVIDKYIFSDANAVNFSLTLTYQQG